MELKEEIIKIIKNDTRPEVAELRAIEILEKIFPTQGCKLAIQERLRQIKEEKWTTEHDYQHSNYELSIAGACYALPLSIRKNPILGLPIQWPWSKKWWKPTPDNRIRELEKASALIIAEMDRILNVKDYNDYVYDYSI